MGQTNTVATSAEFFITPARTFRGLMTILAVLATAHYVATFADHLHLDGRDPTGLVQFFRMGTEANLPTFYSTVLLMIAGFLLSIISATRRQAGDRFSFHWAGLAAGFFFLALDEAAQFHEGVVGRILGNTLGRGDGVLRYLWYLVYIPIVAVIGVGYIRFLKSLAPAFRREFIIAAGLFLGGAVGLEVFEATLASEGIDRFWLWVSHGVEESAEIAGISVFVVALLRFLGEEGTRPTLVVVAPPRSK